MVNSMFLVVKILIQHATIITIDIIVDLTLA